MASAAEQVGTYAIQVATVNTPRGCAPLMTQYEDRLNAFRGELARRKLDGFVVPRTDEYLSENVGAYAQRLAWLTGFQGSAGSAVVLPAEAAIFVDGRYTLQVREQVDPQHWSYQSLPQTNAAVWLGEHARAGARIGYDPWLHTANWVTAARTVLAAKGAELVAVAANPVNAVWTDRPLSSDTNSCDVSGRELLRPLWLDQLVQLSASAVRVRVGDTNGP